MRGPALVKCPVHPILWHAHNVRCPLCERDEKLKKLEALVSRLQQELAWLTKP